VALALWFMATRDDWYLEGEIDKDGSEVAYGDEEDPEDDDYQPGL
jgi:hypothetical protein